MSRTVLRFQIDSSHIDQQISTHGCAQRRSVFFYCQSYFAEIHFLDKYEGFKELIQSYDIVCFVYR